MKILFAIDVQPEFADKDGHYEKILDFIKHSKESGGYDKIIATKCKNRSDSNFVRYNNWHKLIKGQSELEFKADMVIEKQSYGLIDYSFLPHGSMTDIIGYDTGACVLKIALDLFDRDYDFRVLADYCYSTGGMEHHTAGLSVLSNLIEKAIK